mmetsp:Transcript_8914/g.13295  ORF Transcript_8914/g.13295 Transcript_8914/m.13295 type:complete len:258 (+) Transcript_8914:39-812(+)
MVEIDKICKVDQRVCWGIFFALQSMTVVVMMTLAFQSDWVYLDDGNWSGSLSEVTEGEFKGKLYQELSIDFCQRSEESAQCKMYLGLFKGGNFYLLTEVFSIISTLLWGCVLLCYLANVKCLCVSYFAAFLSCKCHFLGLFLFFELGNIGSNCTFSNNYSEKEVCPSTCFWLSFALWIGMLVYIMAYFLVVRSLKKSENQTHRQPQPQEVISDYLQNPDPKDCPFTPREAIPNYVCAYPAMPSENIIYTPAYDQSPQ